MLKFDGHKLKTMRKARKLTQTELALAVFGKPKASHIHNYESNKAAPSAAALLSLMEFFNASINDISVSER